MKNEQATKTLLIILASSYGYSSHADNSIQNMKQTEDQTIVVDNCEFCSQYLTDEWRYALGFSWLNDKDVAFEKHSSYLKHFDWLGSVSAEKWWSTNSRSTITFDRTSQYFQQLNIDYKRQGEYSITGDNSIVRNYSIVGEFRKFRLFNGDDDVTFFSEHTGSLIQLPETWSPIATTSAIDTTSDKINSSTGFRIHQLKLRYDYSSRWKTSVDIQTIKQDGIEMNPASILTSVAYIPLHKQYSTDHLQAFAIYQSDLWFIQWNYSLSLFQNQHTITNWQNPFLSTQSMPNILQYSQAPDNQFHQWGLAYAYRWDARQQFSLSAAFGLGTQDDDFAPLTSNVLMMSEALPRNSLDGKVKTSHLRLQYTNKWHDNWQIKTQVKTDKRNNQTRSEEYAQWGLSNHSPELVTNQYFDFSKQRYSANIFWQALPKLNWQLEHQYHFIRRANRAIKINEGNSDLTAKFTPSNSYDVTFQLGRKSRRGNAQWDSSIEDDKNLLSRFHAQSFNRNEWKIKANYFSPDSLMVGIEFTSQREKYPQSLPGFNSTQHYSAQTHLGFQLFEQTSASIFASKEKSNTTQSGGVSGYSSLWTNRYQDHIYSFGFSTSYQPKTSEWKLETSLIASHFIGKSHTQTVLSEEPFPDLKRSHQQIRIQPSYQFNRQLTLNLDYRYERLKNRDWQDDLFTVDAITRLIPPRLMAPRYDIHLFVVKMDFSFD